MPVTPVNYTNSNTTLGYTSADLSNLLIRREYFTLGGLYTWGTNLDFGLGDGTTISRSSPGTTVGGGLTSWEWIDCKARSGAGIKSDGTLWTWGRGTYGVLGYNSAVSRSSPGTTAVGGTTWDEVSTSTAHMLAVKNDGTLWTWGRNVAGQLGTGNVTSRSSPGTTAGAALNGISDAWKTVSAGGDSSAAIKNDGTLWTWGLNTAGMLGDGTTTSRSSPGTTAGAGTNWVLVALANDAAGLGFGAAVKSDGTLWTWGNNSKFQLGNGTTTDRSSPGTVAGGGTTWKQVSCGVDHAVALKTNGTLWTWGANGNGETGNGAAEVSRSSPNTTAGGGNNWKYVNAAFQISAGIKTDGTLWTWGRNVAGELGVGDTTNRSSPTQVSGSLLNWESVAMGSASTNGSSIGIVENETNFPDIVVYTTPGTFTETIPEGKQSAFFEAWGAGGRGGDGYNTLRGGGGGSGGYARTFSNVLFQVGKTANVVVGLGIEGGGGGSGSPGGNTYISSLTYTLTQMRANGGFGGSYNGLAGGPGNSGGSGNGGTATGGTEVNTTGNSGATGASGGAGGVAIAGRNAVGYGAGGQGTTGNPGNGGGASANGAVIITYM